MALYVQKFGGSSLASIERINKVADIITKTRKAGHDVVVVVSAMQGETDRLIGLAKNISSKVVSREYDALVSTGEQVSSSLLAMALQARGQKARSYTGAQAGIYTDSHYRKARIVDINTEVLKTDIHNGCMAVIAGFQGIDNQGFVTTLGRGGSDITAVAVAAALRADECQIFTDVEGVYTSDPRVVSSARYLEKITFSEMLALSGVGAKVLQIRAVEFAQKYKVPLRVLSSFSNGSGTLITKNMHDRDDELVISGVAFDRNQARITVPGLSKGKKQAQCVLDAINEASIEVDMALESEDFSFTVSRDEYQHAFDVVSRVVDGGVVGNDQIAKLSLIGLDMKSHAGVASKIFQVLGEQGIDVHSISSSEVKISMVIDERHLEQGAQLLHSAFGLDVA